MAKRLMSPEESQKHDGVIERGGGESREEGGFSEGEHGRGPMPYLRRHSSKPDGHSLDAHMSDTGRGGGGIIGKGDDFKGRSEDVAHPASHSEFEALGTEIE